METFTNLTFLSNCEQQLGTNNKDLTFLLLQSIENQLLQDLQINCSSKPHDFQCYIAHIRQVSIRSHFIKFCFEVGIMLYVSNYCLFVHLHCHNYGRPEPGGRPL